MPSGSLAVQTRIARPIYTSSGNSLQHLSSLSAEGRGLHPWQAWPFAAPAVIRLTAFTRKSVLRSEELGRRAKAWIFITGTRVTFLGLILRNGADSGDTSSSSSILGYNLASWRKKGVRQKEGPWAVSGKARWVGSQGSNLYGPKTSSRNITGWRELDFPEFPSSWWLLWLERAFQ